MIWGTPRAASPCDSKVVYRPWSRPNSQPPPRRCPPSVPSFGPPTATISSALRPHTATNGWAGSSTNMPPKCAKSSGRPDRRRRTTAATRAPRARLPTDGRLLRAAVGQIGNRKPSGAAGAGVCGVGGRAVVDACGAAQTVVTHAVGGVQYVVAVASDEMVNAEAGEDGVGTSTAELPVSAAAAEHLVVIGAAGETVALAAALDKIGAQAARDLVPPD